ncbi:MAG: PAS domain S-box protein [Acidobacteriaceae bacterium]|nr:PAS domain S-box protein [Acidobacteriaceae bacterium]
MQSGTDASRPVHLSVRDADGDDRWRTAFENSAIGIALLDLEARFVTVNPAYQRMLGYSEAEFQAMSCLEITYEEDQARSRSLFSELLDGRRPHIQVEKRLRRKDGTPIWIRLNESLVPGTDKTTPFLLAVVEDITERKRAEEALHRSELLYKELVNNIPEGLFALDVTADKRFKFAGLNEREEQAVGYSSAEVTGRYVEEVLPAELANKVLQHYRLCLESGIVTEYKEELEVPTGRHFFHTTLIPVRNADGTVYRIVGCCKDLTEMRRAQQEAAERQKLESLGVLAGGIAHDFNNLLGSILGNAELAETRLAAGFPAVEEIETIKTVAIRAAEIVRELIIYAGQDQGDAKATDVSHRVEEMLHLLRVSISKRVILKTDLQKDLPEVPLNPAQVGQILMNLIVNASESFGDNDGVITIKTSLVRNGGRELTQRDCVRLEVSDNGCGIAEEVRAKIFDPFFTTKFAGRGLGLAVVQGIVRAHEGVVDVRSTPGEGTTFQVLLPCASLLAQEAVAAGTATLREYNDPITRTVLFVDDEETLRFAACRMLRKRNFSVVEAGDGRTAFDLLHTYAGRIDLLLLDMTLPGTPAGELITEASRIRPDTNIILTSAYNKEMVMNGLNAPQIRGFIRKPFRLDELVQLINNVLAAHGL